VYGISGWTILAGVAVAVASSLVYLTIAASALERVEADLRAWEKQEERKRRREAEMQATQAEKVPQPVPS